MLETFRPLIDAAAGVDLSDPTAARSELSSHLDPSGATAAAMNEVG